MVELVTVPILLGLQQPQLVHLEIMQVAVELVVFLLVALEQQVEATAVVQMEMVLMQPLTQALAVVDRVALLVVVGQTVATVVQVL
jgi:hypothetical protein